MISEALVSEKIFLAKKYVVGRRQALINEFL